MGRLRIYSVGTVFPRGSILELFEIQNFGTRPNTLRVGMFDGLPFDFLCAFLGILWLHSTQNESKFNMEPSFTRKFQEITDIMQIENRAIAPKTMRIAHARYFLNRPV